MDNEYLRPTKLIGSYELPNGARIFVFESYRYEHNKKQIVREKVEVTLLEFPEVIHEAELNK